MVDERESEAETLAIGDETLSQEVETMATILEAAD
jgi:hypothetical protein